MKSERLCTEFKTAIGRNFLSGHMLVSFQSIDRFYFYHHIQVLFLHTLLSSEIIRYMDGNFSFSVRLGKFTSFFQYFEFFISFHFISCAAVV